MELSPDQDRARLAVLQWLSQAEGRQPYMTLGGLAGTGKSTLISVLISEIGGLVMVCAPTGKAAHVLRQKGIESARTVHKLIYQPINVCTWCNVKIDTGIEICERTAHCKKAERRTEFEGIEALMADLIIVDEASMISNELHEDLLSYDRPVLYVGDHGQLEPVGPNPRLMKDPDIKLETIHRQAEGSPILAFAHHVRRHGRPKTTGPEAQVKLVQRVPPEVSGYDVVIVGRNATRVAVNAKIRKDRRFTGDLPQPGERIVCLRNHSEYKIYNGMLAQVVDVRIGDDGDDATIDIVDESENAYRNLVFEPAQFGHETTMTDTPRRKALFDYGYCLTAHKCQGSDFDRVAVIEWIHPQWSPARWRYTAATRAKKELLWCMKP